MLVLILGNEKGIKQEHTIVSVNNYLFSRGFELCEYSNSNGRSLQKYKNLIKYEKFKSKKVSVAIPTFNSSKYILQCVKPILSSKFIDEIIISDDFSSLTEFEILKRHIEEIKYSTDKKIEL